MTSVLLGEAPKSVGFGRSQTSRSGQPARTLLGARVRARTRAPGFHFFGYFDKSPWNAAMTRVVAGRVEFNQRGTERPNLGAVAFATADEGGLERKTCGI